MKKDVFCVVVRIIDYLDVHDTCQRNVVVILIFNYKNYFRLGPDLS